MKSTVAVIIAACFLIMAGAAVNAAAKDCVPSYGSAPNAAAARVAYLSCATGAAGRNQMSLDDQDYNLKMIFDIESDNLLSEVIVKIQDAKGNVLINAASEGPWFFARLPVGRYRVMTYFNEQEEFRNVVIDHPGQSIIENWTF